jgi:hypothetical protein
MRFQRTRWIPKDATEVKQPDGLGVAYVYQIGDKGYGVIGYGGKRTHHDFHYSFKSTEAVYKKIEEWFAGLKGHIELIAQYRKERQRPNELKVGDIIVNSWGYDQTNVDWYKVVKASEHFVWLQPIEGHFDETGFMSGHSVAGEKELGKAVEMHAARGKNVTFRYGAGHLWDGKPQYESYYA